MRSERKFFKCLHVDRRLQVHMYVLTALSEFESEEKQEGKKQQQENKASAQQQLSNIQMALTYSSGEQRISKRKGEREKKTRRKKVHLSV